MFCITFDIDGNVVSKEEKPKRWKPRNGFQRGDDGNFYKQLGDPRNISDIEAAEAIKAEREKAERERQEALSQASKNEKVEQAIEDKVNETKQYVAATRKGKQVFRPDPQWRVTDEELNWAINWKGKSCSDSGNFVAYREAKLALKFGVPTIDNIEHFDRIEVLLNKNLIKFWVKHYISGNEPDYVLVNGLK